MEISGNPAALFAALSMVQAMLQNIGFDSSNPMFGSRYASLGAVVAELRKVCGSNKLGFSQFVSTCPDGQGGFQHLLETVIFHESGSYMTAKQHLAVMPDKAGRITPQGVGSATTYARRYALLAAFGLAGEEDDDGNAATGHHTAATASTAAARITQQQQRNGRPAPRPAAPAAPAAAPAAVSPNLAKMLGGLDGIKLGEENRLATASKMAASLLANEDLRVFLAAVEAKREALRLSFTKMLDAVKGIKPGEEARLEKALGMATTLGNEDRKVFLETIATKRDTLRLAEMATEEEANAA